MYIIMVNDKYLSYNTFHNITYLSDMWSDPNDNNKDREMEGHTCLFANMVEASKAIKDEEFWFMMPDCEEIKIVIIKIVTKI